MIRPPAIIYHIIADSLATTVYSVPVSLHHNGVIEAVQPGVHVTAGPRATSQPTWPAARISNPQPRDVPHRRSLARVATIELPRRAPRICSSPARAVPLSIVLLLNIGLEPGAHSGPLDTRKKFDVKYPKKFDYRALG